MKLRQSNLGMLLETRCVVWQEIIDDNGEPTGRQIVVTNEDIFGEEKELDYQTLIDLAEMLAASRDMVFSFEFNPNNEYPWSGGLYKWNKPIDLPKSEEEAKKLEGIDIRKFTDRWLADNPDVAVFDRDMPNLFCQLVAALAEMFEVSTA